MSKLENWLECVAGRGGMGTQSPHFLSLCVSWSTPRWTHMMSTGSRWPGDAGVCWTKTKAINLKFTQTVADCARSPTLTFCITKLCLQTGGSSWRTSALTRLSSSFPGRTREREGRSSVNTLAWLITRRKWSCIRSMRQISNYLDILLMNSSRILDTYR